MNYDYILKQLRKHQTAGKLKDVRPTKKGIHMSVFNGRVWQNVWLNTQDINRIVSEII